MLSKGFVNNVYLTFDDGPDPDTTPAVLDLLKAHQAKATFFVIVERAKRQREILGRIIAEGHAVGNHSMDHRYSHFFSSRKKLKSWIENAQRELTSLMGKNPIGFRSPAGIWTPPLNSVLSELQIPLIYWNMRFYDAVFSWTEAKAQRALAKIEAESIVLLHDHQPEKRRQMFLKTFDYFLREVKKRGFTLNCLGENDHD